MKTTPKQITALKEILSIGAGQIVIGKEDLARLVEDVEAVAELEARVIETRDASLYWDGQFDDAITAVAEIIRRHDQDATTAMKAAIRKKVRQMMFSEPSLKGGSR